MIGIAMNAMTRAVIEKKNNANPNPTINTDV